MAKKNGSIMERISDIMQSNIHALLDKCENKEKMLDQEMRKALDELADLKDSAIQLKADVKGAQRNYDAMVAKMQAEHSYAVNAMKSGDEASAAKFLQSEAKVKAEQVDPAKRNLDAATKNFETMQAAYNKLADDIEFMKNEMNNIKGTMRVAKATDKVASMKDNTGSYASNFSRYSEAAQRMLDEANARIEMNEEPVDEMAELRRKYAGGMQPDMSEALAGLRAECGMSGASGSAESKAVEAVQAMDDAMAALRAEAGAE